MKFYIAGRLKQMNKIKEIQDFIKNKGHEIHTDWTEHLPPKPYSSDENKSSEFATIDIKGAMECDVFVLLSDEAGTGMYTELGSALANKINMGSPHIYVIGDHLTKPIFLFHPEVTRKNNIDEVFEDLNF
jgi:hypothetical protein